MGWTDSKNHLTSTTGPTYALASALHTLTLQFQGTCDSQSVLSIVQALNLIFYRQAHWVCISFIYLVSFILLNGCFVMYKIEY